MKCPNCHSAWTPTDLSEEVFLNCPYCGAIMDAEEIANSLEQTFRAILQQLGETEIRDGKKFIACFKDLAPFMKREQRILEPFVNCNGHSQLLDAKRNGNSCVKASAERIVCQMNTILMNAECCRLICEAFCKAIGCEISLDRPPKPVFPASDQRSAPVPAQAVQPPSQEQGGGEKPKKKMPWIAIAVCLLLFLCASYLLFPRNAGDKQPAEAIDTKWAMYAQTSEAKTTSSGLSPEITTPVKDDATDTTERDKADETVPIEPSVFMENKHLLACGLVNAYAVKSDGTVLSNGGNRFGQREVSDWENIVDIDVGFYHVVGLRSDGTVIAIGDNESGQCNVTGLTDISNVAAGFYFTVLLRSNGTVVAVGSNKYGQLATAHWTNIIAIAAGGQHSIGLKSDGTVVAAGMNEAGQCDIPSWSDVVAVAAGGSHTVVLFKDGTVSAIGNNENGQCNVEDWTDIIAISCGGASTVGLKSDGTVVAAGWNDSNQCQVGGWRNIVAIAAGDRNTIALQADGRVVSTTGITKGQDFGQSDVEAWVID